MDEREKCIIHKQNNNTHLVHSLALYLYGFHGTMNHISHILPNIQLHLSHHKVLWKHHNSTYPLPDLLYLEFALCSACIAWFLLL